MRTSWSDLGGRLRRRLFALVEHVAFAELVHLQEPYGALNRHFVLVNHVEGLSLVLEIGNPLPQRVLRLLPLGEVLHPLLFFVLVLLTLVLRLSL